MSKLSEKELDQKVKEVFDKKIPNPSCQVTATTDDSNKLTVGVSLKEVIGTTSKLKTQVTKKDILAAINKRYDKFFAPADAYRVRPIAYDNGGVNLEVLNAFGKSQGDNFFLHWTEDLFVDLGNITTHAIAVSIRSESRRNKDLFESILRDDGREYDS